MTEGLSLAAAGIALHVLVEVALVVRVILLPDRQPASRVAWIVVIIAVPVVGILSYLSFGEVRLGRARVARRRNVVAGLRNLADATNRSLPEVDAPLAVRHGHLFRMGHSITGFEPVGGNHARLLADSNAAIDAMVTDIDAATEHVHLLFYIWLTDRNGCRVAEALQRAAGRGVRCRAMADGLGSHGMIHSRQWQRMREAGVDLAVSLPIGNPLLRMLSRRVDLRNHRKIVVIDGRITYCGSQNCADPEFRVKPKYAPWVDIMLRFEGPIATQNQALFASDWMTDVDEDLGHLLREPASPNGSGVVAQVVGTGPTVRYSAMPEMFESLMYAARRELVISTPYYVPDESMQGALRAAAYRGVETSIVFPARNDSWVVAAASRSYYAELLAAGVRIHEYQPGLLHAKTLTVDGEITLIGSANMDRRSFDLNYENNILFVDTALTASVRERQQQYLAESRPVHRDEVAAWPVTRRLWNNTVAILGPLL